MTVAVAKKSVGRRVLRGLLWLLLILAVLMGGFLFWNRDLIQRVFLGGIKAYETTPPALPTEIKHPAILVFSKTNGFRHEEAIPAANALFAKMAKDNGWGFFQTENGATFNPEILGKFDVVVFNNTSGDVFTPEQKAAFRSFVENGGGYVGIHAAGDDSHSWDWFVTNLIGTRFIGHPMEPQFQKAKLRVENRNNPATAHLPETWERTDEWYSFDSSPRKKGFNVLMTLDESSYSPVGMFDKDIRMGKDHPMMWWKCVGKGRMFYSALGHTAESYAEPLNQDVLKGAISWAMQTNGGDCPASAPPAAPETAP